MRNTRKNEIRERLCLFEIERHVKLKYNENLRDTPYNTIEMTFS